MLDIVFKNLEPSELAREAVKNKLGHVFEKFEKAKDHRVRVCLSMENSPLQAGRDVFGVRVSLSGRFFNDIILEKKSESLYIALAHVADALLERLNRDGDKKRVKNRANERNLQKLELETDFFNVTN